MRAPEPARTSLIRCPRTKISARCDRPSQKRPTTIVTRLAPGCSTARRLISAASGFETSFSKTAASLIRGNGAMLCRAVSAALVSRRAWHATPMRRETAISSSVQHDAPTSRVDAKQPPCRHHRRECESTSLNSKPRVRREVGAREQQRLRCGSFPTDVHDCERSPRICLARDLRGGGALLVNRIELFLRDANGMRSKCAATC